MLTLRDGQYGLGVKSVDTRVKQIEISREGKNIGEQLIP